MKACLESKEDHKWTLETLEILWERHFDLPQ